MKIKAIALDLDGTLLTTDKKISDTNREILKELNSRGVKIFLVTGRTYLATKPYALDLDAGGVVIAYNGAKVVDYENDRVIFELPLEADYVKELIKISRRLGVPLNLYKDNKWYVEDSSKKEVIRYGSERDMIPIEKDFYDFDDYKMTKSVFLGTEENPETLENVHREVKKILGIDGIQLTDFRLLLQLLEKKGVKI